MKAGIVHPAVGYRTNRKSDMWFYRFWRKQGFIEYYRYTYWSSVKKNKQYPRPSQSKYR